MALQKNDFEELAKAALEYHGLIETLLPGGRLRGREYTCATINGGEGDSMSINTTTGVWSDFSTGQSGHDLISLVAEQQEIKQSEAAKQLAEMIRYDWPTYSGGINKQKKSSKKEKPELIWPVPDNVKRPPNFISRNRKPAGVWEYRDIEGRLLGFVVRYDKPETDEYGKPLKDFLPWTYTQKGWRWQGFKEPLPFFNLPQLAKLPTGAPVIILEGEAKTQALQSILGANVAVLGLHGGAKRVHKMDFTVLRGQRVIYWPDNDAPGFNAALDAAGLAMAAKVESFSIVNPPLDAPKKWDAKDAIDSGWNKQKTEEFLRDSQVTPKEFGKIAADRWNVTENTREKKSKPKNDPPLMDQQTLALGFKEKYQNNLRYDHDCGKWFCWTGQYWEKDRDKAVFDRILLHCREIAATLDTRQCREVSSKATASAVNAICQAYRPFAFNADKWDQDDWLLGTPGGTVNLRTGEMKPATPTDYITQITTVTPSKNEDCPLWLNFLCEAVKGETDAETWENISFLRKVAGLGLTGSTREQKLFFVYGSGGNGKSVFLDTLANVIGAYGTVASIETFEASKTDKHPTDLAALMGKRLVYSSETEQGRRWAESRIKNLTGGDLIQARFMRQDFFTFRPKFTLIIIGNHKPNFSTIDDAIKRRIVIIPFINKPENPDPDLTEKLKVEYPGILRWMINGCIDWQKNGLLTPRSVQTETDEYFENQDLFGRWIEESCDLCPQFSTGSTKLFNSWKDFAEQNGVYAGNSKTFADEMDKRGFGRPKHGRNGSTYFGITLKNQNDLEDQRSGKDNW